MGLELSGVTVRYGATEAVSEVDLSVADGEVLALLGPSGCGKSTLLRAVAGLERPNAGQVRWDGTDLSGVAVHRRGFGLVFQDGQLFPHRDVAANVAFGLRMHGVDRAARSRRVDELLELVGLDGYQQRRVTELSGGEQQRVALARALAPAPRLLLLDEPLSALDRVLREQLAVDLAGLLRQTGTTALVVTHDHDEAFTLADRVALMQAGRIRQVGPPDEVWRRPADEEVAGFLGCTTFVPGTASDGVVSSVLGAVDLPGTADGSVRLGLRANALRADTEGSVRGEVVQRLHRRDHARLLVRLDVVASPVEAVAPVVGPPGTGDHVHLVLDPDGVAVIQPSFVDSRP
ncbi:ABC transporter ATP-binding protein [Kutzneria albida]|uniref:ABC-type quaternary amine transporter n=1 Tax=Kutzneria albida DSM 43870 TaxID=1449976 RepID=W5W178_9PSEU|nr:ABC transporter ATP-binding protein [Kutzneria albida]AHH94286.1 Fe(3+) ions import ATP-binding protein FbpC [Kutzneria albida DSM 43870]